MRERVVVLGCGGIGGVVAGELVAAGHDVHAVTGNAAIAQALAERGLSSRLARGLHRQVSLRAQVALSPGDGPFDIALLALPPSACEAATRQLLPHLGADAPVVCLANGLVEERLGAWLPPDRVVGAVVSFGASMHGPGQVEQTSGGGFAVGGLAGEPDARVERVAALLSSVAPVKVTANLRGARWSKLAINCAISSLGTLGGDRLGALMRHRFVRRLCLEIMSEVTAVALAEGVQLEKVAGTLDLEWLALDDEERRATGSPSLLAKHAVLLAVGARYRRLRSSMLAAIERGRAPPVAFLNGEVVDRAGQRGCAVPVNAAVQHRVEALGRGEGRSSLRELQELYASTRTVAVSARGLRR